MSITNKQTYWVARPSVHHPGLSLTKVEADSPEEAIALTIHGIPNGPSTVYVWPQLESGALSINEGMTFSLTVRMDRVY